MPKVNDEPDHVRENRRYWDGMADQWVAAGERNWECEEPSWGIWSVAERELELLPANMSGMKAVELGCGTGYVSGWMARRGANVTGIDNSERQLTTARRLAERHGVELRLVHGDAEETPFETEEFDFAISEYGAAIWCDPNRWIPEAHRILKPAGTLVFLGNHPLVPMCSPLDGSAPLVRELVRPYFSMHRFDWSEVPVDPGGIEFNLPLSGWFELFRRVGFIVEDYREPHPSESDHRMMFYATADWARSWPTEQVFKLRKAS